jgi:hypothetical protein
LSFLSAPKPFLETNAWQQGANNSLRYNTSQAGSVLPLIYGKTRQQINLIAFGNYQGPSGKKGKSGPLPIAGENVGKGGGGGGGKKGVGGKKNSTYSIDVAFALCQGPVDIGDTNFVWASPGVAYFQSLELNLYTGEYGQAPDPVFVDLDQDVAYAGTCYVTGTPMDLGSSPVLPNLSFEITGFETGTIGSNFPYDANPAHIVKDFLTNPEHGAGWPLANLDPDIATLGTDNYADYCQALTFAIAPALQVQTEAAAWINELARLTGTAIVWSGTVLKFIPYGDLALDSNEATWEPNLTPEYSFTDDDFLPWTPHLDTADPQIGEDDPVLITRANPADAINWVSIEYLDRNNFYNKNIVPVFDQGSIDLYGLRTEPSIQGSCFCNPEVAAASARLILQRHIYVRNTYKFQVGWRYALLEPMDIVLLTDSRCGLFEEPARITKIEENENGDLIIEAEEILSEAGAGPVPPPIPPGYFPDGAAIGIFNPSLILGPAAGAPSNYAYLSIVDDTGSPWGGVDDSFHDLVFITDTIPGSANLWSLNEAWVELDATGAGATYTARLAVIDWVSFSIYSQSPTVTMNPGDVKTLTCPPILLDFIGTHSIVHPFLYPGLGLVFVIIYNGPGSPGAGDTELVISDSHMEVTRYGHLI